MTPRQRIPMELRLTPPVDEPPRPCRTVRAADRDDLAVLLYAAFRGTVDDEGETFADALAEIDRTFAGGYGKFLPDCSFVAEGGEFLVSACLIGLSEPNAVPLVVFSMTRPDTQRQGWAGYLLRRSISALVDRGHARLRLIVTEGNAPAQLLYESLGFSAILPS
jgi:ribosomal protein S18 acetylase RimI-like enzyme